MKYKSERSTLKSTLNSAKSPYVKRIQRHYGNRQENEDNVDSRRLSYLLVFELYPVDYGLYNMNVIIPELLIGNKFLNQ